MAANNREPKTGSAKSEPISFIDGRGELPMVEIKTPRSTAAIYLHGAHVTYFHKQGESPLLFLSQVSRFAENEPIRGGIPVIFPWFGPREGLPQHGFARLKAWQFIGSVSAQDGSVTLRFHLPDFPEASGFPPCSVDYNVTIGDALTLELLVKNLSQHDIFAFENCLHTYFEIGDINQISIRGLKGADYLDKSSNFARKTETNDAIRISSEVDRMYLDTMSTVEIHDPVLKRKIVVEKHGSASTVVWNPWAAKAQQMPDFGNDEYQRMVCVESGNVASNNIKLPPGETSALTLKLSTQPLG